MNHIITRWELQKKYDLHQKKIAEITVIILLKELSFQTGQSFFQNQ